MSATLIRVHTPENRVVVNRQQKQMNSRRAHSTTVRHTVNRRSANFNDDVVNHNSILRSPSDSNLSQNTMSSIGGNSSILAPDSNYVYFNGRSKCVLMLTWHILEHVSLLDWIGMYMLGIISQLYSS